MAASNARADKLSLDIGRAWVDSQMGAAAGPDEKESTPERGRMGHIGHWGEDRDTREEAQALDGSCILTSLD